MGRRRNEWGQRCAQDCACAYMKVSVCLRVCARCFCMHVFIYVSACVYLSAYVGVCICVCFYVQCVDDTRKDDIRKF
jgi:hypothetical protein